MPSLEVRLRAAARLPDWDTQVVRRCAWCGRVADGDGEYRDVYLVREEVVTTDGMCPPCGAAALAQIAARGAARGAVRQLAA